MIILRPSRKHTAAGQRGRAQTKVLMRVVAATSSLAHDAQNDAAEDRVARSPLTDAIQHH
jgi:hypothetical protein